MHRSASKAHVVVVFAPFGRDAETIGVILKRDGYQAATVVNVEGLIDRLNDETGVVLIAEEALIGDVTTLGVALSHQPAWSDVPFVLLRSRAIGLARAAQPLPPEVINLIELERPLSSTALVAAVGTAMRSRQRQFEIRERMDELARSQVALAESENELRLIADSVPMLIAFIDTDLRYRFVNRAFEEWLQRPIEAIVRRRVLDVLGPDEWKKHRYGIESALAGRPARFEMAWPWSSRRRDVEVRCLPRFSSEGLVDGIHFFATDITERIMRLEAAEQAAVTLEKRVSERTAELQAEMQARAESEATLRQAQKMEVVGQLSGGLAHDFNNMLTGILGGLDMIRVRLEQGRLEGISRIMDAATGSAQRAAGLILRLLAFSRRQSLDPQAVDLSELVRSVNELLTKTLTERVRVVLDLGEGLPAAFADPSQLESALLNLCINARDAMPDGGDVVIRTRADNSAALDNTNADHQAYVVLSVTDSGTGMSPEMQERIFEPFFTTKPIGQGTGLGLSMVYGFVQQSKGRVEVKSLVGHGTTIKLFFPCAPNATAASASTPVVAISVGRGQRILVVEDDPQILTLISTLLEEMKYEVVTAGCADEAMPTLREKPSVDLLISDVGLPGLNGRQLADAARQIYPSLPVLFMTGYAHNVKVRADFLDKGMMMIDKPFSLQEFGIAVQAALAQTS